MRQRLLCAGIWVFWLLVAGPLAVISDPNQTVFL